MTRSAVRRFGLAAAGFLLVVSTARAADDEFEFADALSRRGYTDLAREEFDNLINNPKSSAQRKAEGQYGVALLIHGEARLLAADRSDRKKPMEEVLQKFDLADQAFAKFIQDNPSHPRLLEAKLSRGKLLQDKGEYVNAAIAGGFATGSAPAWQKQVADWYDVAIGLFEAAEKKARDDRASLRDKQGTPEWDEAEERLSLVWLYRIAALYGKGAALPKGDSAGTNALTLAVKEGSDDYQWEPFAQSVRGLWAIHYAGLAAAALDKPNDAFQFLKTAAQFRAEQTTEPAIQDITFLSYAELGRAALAFGKRDKDDWPKKALEFFNGLETGWPDLWKKRIEGQRAGLVWAQLLAHAGQREKAYATAQEVAKAAEAANSPVRLEAYREMSKYMDSTVAGDLGTLKKIALGKWREADYRGCIRAFQAVLANCASKEDWDEYGWDAWDYVGRCYFQLKRPYESFLAFDQIEQAWKKDKSNEKLTTLTDDTGWSRAGALNQVAIQTKDPADKKAFQDAIDEFGRDHPNSPQSLDQSAAAAETKLRAAEEVRNDPVAYKAALADALKAVEAVDAKSDQYETFRARIAQVQHKIAVADDKAFDLAMLDKAIATADAWLAEKRPEATKSTIRTARERGRRFALAVVLAARADKAAALAKSPDRAVAQKANQDLLAALDKYGPDFKEVAADAQAKLDSWRAEGLIGTGKIDDADQLVGRLLAENPASRNNIYLSALMGSALERLAKERLALDDKNGFKQLMLRSARRSEWVLDNAKLRDGSPAPRQPDVIRTIAKRYAEGGEFVKAEALYLEAQKAYDEAAAVAQSPEEKERQLRNSRACRLDLIDLLVKQEKYDAAIPQLEKEIAQDPKVRDDFLKKVQATDNYTDLQYKQMLEKTEVNKTLLDHLSSAYMRAPSKERLTAAVNLAYVLTLTTPKEEQHGEEFVDFLLRRAEAYVMLGNFSRNPEHFKQAAATIRNKIVIPGFVEGYEQTLAGSKKRGEKALRDAEDGLRKLGSTGK